MELIQMYQTPTGMECFIGLVSIIVGIIAVVELIMGGLERDKKQFIIGVVATVFTLMGIFYCTHTKDLNVYTYKMNNPTELAQMLNDGWVVENHDGIIYELIKKY